LQDKIPLSFRLEAEGMPGYQNFEFSVFITTQDIIRIFSDDETAKCELAFFTKHTKLSKVYVEYFRGEVTPLPLLLKARDFFNANGIKTAVGIMPVSSHFEVTGRMLCFTNPEVISIFHDGLAGMAKYFDEIMIDDSLSTDCTCERCRAAKGDRDWQSFRTEYMADFCRDHIIAPAKAINPNVKITLKYPTWHESFQWLGYNT